MAPSRRNFLQLAAGAAASQALPTRKAQAATAGPAGDAGAMKDQLTSHFGAKGYQAIASHDLITPHAFNDGLRYDEAPEVTKLNKQIQVQACGRVEDIARRDVPGVLAYFHILVVRDLRPAARGDMLAHGLDFMINQAGLNPARLALVSTPWFDPYKPTLQDFGLKPSQLVVRSIAEAEAAGDGSGYFNPKGQPFDPLGPTVSIHYALRDDTVVSDLAYPVPGYIELAEATLRVGPKANTEMELIGFGLERMAMARGGTIETFEQSREKLLTALEAEAQRRGVALPPAYGLFKSA